MDDTPSKIEKFNNEMLLSKAPSERLKMASGMFDTAKKLVISGLFKERRKLDRSRLKAEVFLRIYGNDFSAGDRERIMKQLHNSLSPQSPKGT